MKTKLLKKIRKRYYIGIIYDDLFEAAYYFIIQKTPAKENKNVVNEKFLYRSDFWRYIYVPGVDCITLYLRNKERKMGDSMVRHLEVNRLKSIEKIKSRYENKTTEEVKENI